MDNNRLNDIHLKLLAGLPINIDSFVYLMPIKVREVIEMNESLYYSYLGTLLFDKNDIKDQSEEFYQEKNINLLSIFLVYDASFKEVFFNAMNLFFGVAVVLDNDGFVYLIGKNSNEVCKLTEEMFEDIRQVLKIANFLKDEKKDEYIAGNDKAKEFIEKLKRKKKEAEKLKKPKMNLHSIISGLAWKTHGIETVMDLTLYQLHDAHQRIEQIDNYMYTLTGIYTGNIDGKKVKLPDINWANIIKHEK